MIENIILFFIGHEIGKRNPGFADFAGKVILAAAIPFIAFGIFIATCGLLAALQMVGLISIL